MLSKQWPWPKWIKYIAVQGGSAHPSGWNIKLILQLKMSFFSTGHQLSPLKFFRSRFNPKRGYETNVQKKSVENADFEREERWRPTKLSPAFQHQATTSYSLATHVTHRTTNKKPTTEERLTPSHLLAPVSGGKRQPVKNDLQPLTSWPVSGGKREPVSLLTYQLLFILW